LFDDDGLYAQPSNWLIGSHIRKKNTCTKEIIMRSHGHATVWGTPMAVGCAKKGARWYEELREWWATHKAMRREAKLAALTARWDATREALKPLKAEAACEMVAAEHGCSTAITLYGLANS
jgi:hypothetical protein